MWAKLTKQWFLIALAIVFAAGCLAAESLDPWVKTPGLRSGVMFAVMWAMGVTLPADTIRKSLTRPAPTALAIGMNMFLVPLLALPASGWLPDSEFGGLFVASIVPCTLAGASVWTRKAGGDDAIAMMTTVVTNLACVIVAPIGIWIVLSERVEIHAADQIGRLSLLVVAPLILAQSMRRFGLHGWADRHKSTITATAQLGILVMVLLGAAATGMSSDAGSAGIRERWHIFALLLGTTLAIHVLTLIFGVLAAQACGMRRGQQIAIGIAASQKTLMVGLQIAMDLGVSVLPMLLYHSGQLFLDTWIAQRWRKRNPDGT